MFLGCRRINVSCWKRTEQLGHVRDVVFVAPIKGAFSNWGVPETNCHQSHRWATLCDSQHAHSCLRCAMDRPPTRLPAWSLPRFCKFTSHHSDAHIVFETSQTMNDIPYGDCFTVDQRWDIRVDRKAPDGVGPQVLIDIHLRVPFSRSCFFKKVCPTCMHIPLAVENLPCLPASHSYCQGSSVSRSLGEHGPHSEPPRSFETLRSSRWALPVSPRRR